jgi:hypothetical protein
MSVEKRLEGLPAEKRLEGLSAEQRLEGLTEEDFKKLSPEARARLLRYLTGGEPPAPK